jgi:class 3 adenylate cyclase/predicted ATPase
MTDLKEWLSAHGLEQYSQQFADNDIDFDVLGDLTEADLEKLGLSLGHRRKLVRALDAHQHESDPPAIGVAPKPGSVAAETPDAAEAERRQITVLFGDLVGSTQLAQALDPEDAGALIRRYQDVCSGAVARFDGYVAKFMGDGVLAYFGYPQANEEAAEQAVRTAFAIIDAVPCLKHPDGRPFAVRIGIATGIVVIGDMLGEGSARERSIVGDTPNLAARLQAMANPNEVLISLRTFQLLGRRFEYTDLGERTLKGFAAPVPVWRVLHEAKAESRFAAARAAKRGAFVGRSEESSLLLDRWRRATQGQGQALLISGEPGMGKSRLVDMLSDGIGDERRYRVTCQCSPYHMNSALYPVIRHLERAAEFASEDTDVVKLAKLEAMLTGLNGEPDALETSLIADLLSLSLPSDRNAALDLSPPQRKEATLSALVNLLTGMAEDAPVLLLLEDAHWIDPTTTELWTRLLDSITATRLLALITARPEFAPPWTGRARVSSLELQRLTNAQAAQLAAEIAAPRRLESALVDDIVTKSDGLPLFVEELTKAVLESATPERPVVPATLHDSLMARLDRLGPAKDIAQVAAVIGQRFSHTLLAAIVPCSGAELSVGLTRLIEAGLAYRSGRLPDTTYSFKHALLRDVAYENLLRARRQQLHERIGRVLIESFASVAESEPELIAYHFHQARLFELAITYRERAGDRAVSRSSFAEAIVHFSAALCEAAQLEPGPEAPDRMRRELGLLLKLGPVLAVTTGYHSAEVADAYQRAHHHAVALGDEDGLFKATWGLWINDLTTRRLDRARDQADALVKLARASGNDDYLLEGFHCLWGTAQFRGDVTSSLKMSGEGIQRYDRGRHSWMGPVFGGHDPGVCAHVVRAIALSLRGHDAEAKRSNERAILLADELKHPNSQSHALLSGMVAAQIGSDHQVVDQYAQRLIALADKYNLPPARAHALFLSGCCRAFTTDTEAGLKTMETEFPRASALGPFSRYYAALLAEGREKSGRYQEALVLLAKTLETVTEPGVGFYISELYRLQGMCLLRVDGANKDEAMRSLHTAVAVAREQRATVLELRAAMSLTRAAIEIGCPAEGLASLRELCATLPPEFDPAILREAKELLLSVRT